jgi:hypothetical protein
MSESVNAAAITVNCGDNWFYSPPSGHSGRPLCSAAVRFDRCDFVGGEP